MEPKGSDWRYALSESQRAKSQASDNGEAIAALQFAKQDAIEDLDQIRSGAALGATALQSYTETDPTVPSWAKASSKPTYTASEVGALPDSTVIPTVPTNLSGFVDDLGSTPKHTHSQYLTTSSFDFGTWEAS